MKYINKKIFIILLLISCTVLAKNQNKLLDLNQTKSQIEENENYHVSGFILGEVIYSNYNQGAGGRFAQKSTYSTFCFPRANVMLEGQPSKWASGKLALNFRESCGFGSNNDEWTFRKFGISDEAYFTFHNFSKTPIYSRIGIQYLPYGVYTRHKIPVNFTQMLTQTQAAGLSSGLTEDNYDITGFVFSNNKKRNSVQRIANWGLQASVNNINNYPIELAIGYMYNIAGAVNYLTKDVVVNNVSSNPLHLNYRKSVSGGFAHVNIKREPFDFIAQYTAALTKFSPSDLRWRSAGARPSAATVSLGYSFIGFNFPSRVEFSYQKSWQAVNARGPLLGRGIPRNRYQIEYVIMPTKWIRFGPLLLLDRDYKLSDNGTGKESYTVLFHALLNVL